MIDPRRFGRPSDNSPEVQQARGFLESLKAVRRVYEQQAVQVRIDARGDSDTFK